jgi:hypothetical protein
LALIVVFTAAIPASGEEPPLLRVRVETPEARSLAASFAAEGRDLIRSSVTDSSLEIIVDRRELPTLEQLGLTVSVVAEGRPFAQMSAGQDGEPEEVPRGYLDLDGVLAEMTQVAADFPDICELVDLTRTYGVAPTFEGRHIHVLKISDNVTLDEDEPAVLLVSAHHCREVITPVIAMHAVDQLTTGYGGDPSITAIVDGQEIWVAPIWNPDGYVHVFEVDNLWRKNRRVFPRGVGVDLNRNYPFGWFTECAGDSDVPSNNYKGPRPASEAETQTMLAWSLDRRFAKVLDFHSEGRELIWGYDCTAHPFDAFLEQEAVVIAQLANFDLENVIPPSADGEHYQWQLGDGAAHAFLIETYVDIWQPEHSEAVAEAERVWPATMWMLERPIPLHGHVTEARTGGALQATITYRDVTYFAGETNGSFGHHGRYHAFLPVGTHLVEFAASGYVPQVHEVQILADESLTLDVTLFEELLAIEPPHPPTETVVPGGTVQVQIEELEPDALVPGTAMVHVAVDDGPFVATPMRDVGGGLFEAALPDAACGAAIRYYFSATSAEGYTQTAPVDAPLTMYETTVAYGVSVAFADDGETDPGWTVENIDLADGAWERGTPAGGGDRFDPPTDYDGSGQCVEYVRWMSSDDADEDRLEVRLSNDDGGSWVLVEAAPYSDEWQPNAIRVEDFLATTASMRLRFDVSDNPSDSITEAAIDAVRIVSFLCDACAADVTGDGVVDVEDMVTVLLAWDTDDPDADIDGDGTVGVADLVTVVLDWGPCR